MASEVVSNRWPDPVQEPLPPRLITEQDISDALALTTRHLLDPEDPAFDGMTFGAICAVRGALAQCAETLRMAGIDRELHGQHDDRREWGRIGEEIVARQVARKVIDDLRKWLPLD